MPSRESRRRLSGTDGPSLVGSVDVEVHIKQEHSDSPFETAELELNDDEAERQRRREEERAKRESMGRPTPRAGGTVPRATSPFAQMSVRQATALLDKGELGEMYAKCVQLSQHGKINQQNAWQLKLVDYLGDVVQMDRETNFQKASHSIDAASKIYGSRVDSVHKDTFKILSSIHTSDGQNGGVGGGGSDDKNGQGGPDGAVTGAARRDRNRRVGRATLATTRAQINEDIKNLLVQVDPMFHKTSSAFDEGGARGLLMNQLFIQGGTNIVFDSSTVLDSNSWSVGGGLNQKSNNNKENESTIVASESVESKQSAIHDESEDSHSLLSSDCGENAEMEEEWMAELSQRCFPQQQQSMNGDSSYHPGEGDEMMDLEWLTQSDMCPQTETFLQSITEMSKGLSVSALDRAILTAHDPIAAGTGTVRLGDDPTSTMMMSRGMHSQDISSAGGPMFDDDLNNADDPAGMMDFANFEDLDINADDLFDEDFDVEVHNAVQERERAAGGVGVVPNGSANTTASTIAADPSLHPRNADMQFDIETSEALQTMAAQRPDIDATVNLNAMNAFIETLEHDDLEFTTAFFDTNDSTNGRKGNSNKGWAGPDQWYRRRHQMRLRKQQNMERNKKARSTNGGFSSNVSAVRASIMDDNGGDKQIHPMLEKDDMDYDPSADPSAIGGGRKKKGGKRANNNADKYIDFMSIAGGEFIEDEKFDPPKRGDNIISNSALEKNLTLTHRIPNDLHIKPSFFIKMFCKPDYSVWRHWLRTYQARAKAAALSTSVMMIDSQSSDKPSQSLMMKDGGSTMVENAEMGRNFDGLGSSGIGADEIEAAANAAIAIQDDDMGDDGFYDYQNPNDEQFVASMLPEALGKSNKMSSMMMMNKTGSPELYSQWDDADFELIAEPSKVEKLTVAFSTKAKRVDVRNLKSKMWERIVKMPVNPNHHSLVLRSSDEEEKKNRDNTNNSGSMKQNNEEYRPFSKVLSGLGNSIEQSQLDVISVPFCFICLLHLANEKGLQFDPVNDDDPMGDFNIFFESENDMINEESVTEMMILG